MTDIPEWAKERVRVLTSAEGSLYDKWITRNRNAFARYIAEHEEPPVDPLLIEARRIVSCNSSGRYGPSEERRIEAGERDRTEPVQVALAALKRGMELAREEKP